MSDYGPQHEQVVAMIERTRVLTAEEVTALGVAWDDALDAAWDAAWRAAWRAALDAARGAAWDAAWRAALDAARGAAWDAAWRAAWDAARGAWYAARGAWYADGYASRDAAWGAARGAACALVVRDLIGQRRFTQEHYDLLTGAWRTVIGPIHPDDKDLS